MRGRFGRAGGGVVVAALLAAAGLGGCGGGDGGGAGLGVLDVPAGDAAPTPDEWHAVDTGGGGADTAPAPDAAGPADAPGPPGEDVPAPPPGEDVPAPPPEDVSAPPAEDVSAPPADDVSAPPAEDVPAPPDVPSIADATADAGAGPDDVPVPPPADPRDPGPLGWATQEYSLSIGGGLFPTNVPLDVTTPDADGPWPVVVLLHGYQLAPSNYRRYAEHLASWGYLVVQPRLPGGLTNHRTLKEDVVAVLDWIDAQAAAPDGALAGRADPGTLGLCGHSLGGKISLLTASEDERVDAVFGIDPVDAAGIPIVLVPDDWPSVTPERMPDITVPLAFVGETVDAACSGFLCRACAPADDNFRQYFENAASPAVAIEVVGANHMSFLDDPDCGLLCSVCNDRSDDPATTHALTQRYLTAFFELVLRGDDAQRTWLTGEGMAADVAAGLVTVATRNGF